MNLRKYLPLVMLLNQHAGASIAVAERDLEIADTGAWMSLAVKPIEIALDVMVLPLSFFLAPPSEKTIAARDYAFVEDFLSQTPTSELAIKEAFEKLASCAVLGHGQALYQMGALMVGMPSCSYALFVPLVTRDEVTGLAYLRRAEEMNIKDASDVLSQFQAFKKFNRAVALAYGIEVQQSLDKARSIARWAAKKSPHAAFFMAEALLKGEQATHPWLAEGQSYSERLVAAKPMLRWAGAAGVPGANELLIGLSRLDRVYEEICCRILSDAEKPINDLVLGEAGFQEAYIDRLVETAEPLLGAPLTPDQAIFFKEAMEKRVKQVYSFYSDYSQYVGSCNKIKGSKESLIDLEDAFKLIVDHVVGKNEIKLPEVAQYFAGKKDVLHPETLHNFISGGLTCPVTELDANTAFRMMFYLHDDFRT